MDFGVRVPKRAVHTSIFGYNARRTRIWKSANVPPLTQMSCDADERLAKDMEFELGEPAPSANTWAFNFEQPHEQKGVLCCLDISEYMYLETGERLAIDTAAF